LNPFILLLKGGGNPAFLHKKAKIQLKEREWCDIVVSIVFGTSAAGKEENNEWVKKVLLSSISDCISLGNPVFAISTADGIEAAERNSETVSGKRNSISDVGHRP
jgi:hypothetical protein